MGCRAYSHSIPLRGNLQDRGNQAQSQLSPGGLHRARRSSHVLIEPVASVIEARRAERGRTGRGVDESAEEVSVCGGSMCV